MQEISLNSWEEFQPKLDELRAQYGGDKSVLLFRGQSDAEWPLVTTLERAGGDGMALSGYHQLITNVRPAIESLTGAMWEFEGYSGQSPHEFLSAFDFDTFPNADTYRYMVYLRHHGFPSPLLDWSASPYVAALFAFRDAKTTATRRAIFVFCETPTGIKSWSGDEPRIRRIGPYVRSHRRHFLQQSDYTMCARYSQSWRYCSHQLVFANSNHNQDVLWKITLPSSESANVLRLLNEYNLNSFSLFGTEESLMETLWQTEIVFKRRPQP